MRAWQKNQSPETTIILAFPVNPGFKQLNMSRKNRYDQTNKNQGELSGFG